MLAKISCCSYGTRKETLLTVTDKSRFHLWFQNKAAQLVRIDKTVKHIIYYGVSSRNTVPRNCVNHIQIFLLQMKPPKTEHFSPKFILIAGVTSAKLPHPFFQTHVLTKKKRYNFL